MRRTAIVRDGGYLDHQAGMWHSESPERLEVIYSMLNGQDMKGVVEAGECG